MNSHHFILPGSIAITMTLVGMLLTALVIAREWERGTMEALLSTQVKKIHIVLGKYIPYFVLGMLSMAFNVFMCIYVFNIPFRGSLFILFLVCGLFLFTALGTGARHNVYNFAWSGQFSYIATTNPVDPYLLYYNSTQFEKGDGVASIGCCVRFIRNINSVLTTQPVDAEGNVYETVTIGTQTYTKQNHKSKKWRTGENINVQDIYTNSAWTALTIPACCAYNNDENNV